MAMTKIAHLEFSVLLYEENDNKVLMIVDAYNENEQRIGSVRKMIAKNLSMMSKWMR